MVKESVLPGTHPLRYYPQPKSVRLRCVKIAQSPYDLFSEPQDAAIWIELGTIRKDAIVPLHIVDKARQTVTATLVGERGGRILVSLDPTQFGSTSFSAEKDDLDAIIEESSPVGG